MKQHFQVTRDRMLMVLMLLLLVVGCATDEARVAPVSGRVTLDGKAVANAKILFAPLERDEDQRPGPIAHATTDDNGYYALTSQNGVQGATVGKNQVWISTRAVESDPDDSEKIVETRPELIPNKYNLKTDLIFNVPDGGSDEAHFALVSENLTQQESNE